MDPDLELRPDEALHDREHEEWRRNAVSTEFWSLILFCFSTGNLYDDHGIFDSNGSALLIRGEY